MVEMTIDKFISALGTAVTTITYDPTQTEGVTLSEDKLTANVYNVILSGYFNNNSAGNSGNITYQFPKTLNSADLRGLDVSKVTIFYYAFNGCTKLTTLNISNWNTSNATRFSNMFYNCNALINLDLGNWNTSKVSDINGIFYKCSSLKTLSLINWDTSNISNISNAFSGVSEATIKISDKWTLGTTATLCNGKNLTFENVSKDLVNYGYLYNTLKRFYTALNISEVKKNAANIAANLAAIETNKTNIATNTTNIETNKANIAINTTAISTEVSDRKTADEKLQASIDANTEAINNLATDDMVLDFIEA